MAEHDLCDMQETPIENKRWLSLMESSGLPHTLAAFASEVFSVEIGRHSVGQREKREVYGDIVIEDQNGTSFTLYRRSRDEAETITKGGSCLSLCMPSKCAVSTTWVCMRMSIKDRVDGGVIVEDVLSFDKVGNVDDYDRVRVVGVVGGTVFVTYAMFSMAVLADVEITVIKNDKSECLPDFYGNIGARYGNTYGKSFPGIKLLNRPSNQSTRLVSNIPIELSRHVVVVPAYSFLRIDLDLYDPCTNQSVVHGKADFLAAHFRKCSDVKIQAQDFIVRVRVQWFHPYEVEMSSKYSKMSTDQQLPPSASLMPSSERSLHKHIGYPLLEVFSVIIGHNGSVVLKICGEMGIIDSSSMTRYLFNRNEVNDLETWSANSKTILIEGPSECFKVPDCLAMRLNLWDVQGQVLIKGNITWNLSLIEWPISWYDRRLCSVSRGMNGYVAVFYTIFESAVQALVEVSFMSNSSLNGSQYVHGVILARYSNEQYSTDYERAYYQSVLFNKPQENSLKLRSGDILPLQKSVVAVPSVASLIVEVDLSTSPLIDGSPGEHFKCVTIFDPILGDPISLEIQGRYYHIGLSVCWTKLFQL